jgi:hypothetical protein
MTSTSIQSSILGPISLIKLHDYDSNHENAELVVAERRPPAAYVPPGGLMRRPAVNFGDLDAWGPIGAERGW